MKQRLIGIVWHLLRSAMLVVAFIFSGWGEVLLALTTLYITMTIRYDDGQSARRQFSTPHALVLTAAIVFGFWLVGVMLRWLIVFLMWVLGSVAERTEATQR